MINGEMHHPKFPRAIQYADSPLSGSLFELNIESIVSKFRNQYPRYSRSGNILIKREDLTKIIKKFESIGEVIQSGGLCRCTYFISSDLFYINVGFIEDTEFLRFDYMIFSDTIDGLNIGVETFISMFNDVAIQGVLCYVTWFYSSKDDIHELEMIETIDDIIYKSAYPYIDIEELADSYMHANEPIILFIGPPGTGKTRLIRYIVKKMIDKSKVDMKIAYTSDQEVITSESFYISFLAWSYNMMIIEDIDAHLKSRESGNTTMYKLLASSDGFLVNQTKNKKIILSTNLSSTEDVDKALLRPGRCFGVIETKALNKQEAINFMNEAYGIDFRPSKDNYTLADLYRIGNKAIK